MLGTAVYRFVSLGSMLGSIYNNISITILVIFTADFIVTIK